MSDKTKKRKARFYYIVRWASDRFQEGGFEYQVEETEMLAQMALDEKKNGRILKVKVVDEWVNVQPRRNSILR